MSKKDKAAVYNILAFTFDGKDDAVNAVKQIKKSGALEGQKIVAEVVVEQDEKGKVPSAEAGSQRCEKSGRGGDYDPYCLSPGGQDAHPQGDH